VKADYTLASALGWNSHAHYLGCNNGGVSQPLVEEVKDREQLNQMIEGAQKRHRPAAKCCA
jgi:hypothetical protein